MVGLSLVVVVFPPFWETNDDPGMAMIAGGYGFASFPSPGLLYSNVLWGQLCVWSSGLVGAGGVAGLQVGLLIILAWLVTVRLRSVGVHGVLIATVVALVFVQPLVYPQFTKVAGLCAAIGCLWLADPTPVSPRRRSMIGIAWLIVGFLIRPDIAALTFLVSLPVIVRRPSTWHRSSYLAGGLCLAAIGLAVGVDRHFYSGAEWNAYRTMEEVRIPFTDYGVANSLGVADAHREGLTVNDIALVSNWFLADPEVANPGALGRVLDHVDWSHRFTDNLRSAARSLTAATQPRLIGLLLAAVVATIASQRRRRLLMSWALLAGSAAALGLIGRPFPLRVWAPALALILLLSLLFQRPRPSRARSLVALAIVGATLASTGLVIRQHSGDVVLAHSAEQDIRELPSGTLHLVWGGSFPSELVYPALRPSSEALDLALVDLGTWWSTPFGQETWHAHFDDAFATSLEHGPLSLIAVPRYISLLRTYCEEHASGPLRIVEQQSLQTFTRYSVTCAPRRR